MSKALHRSFRRVLRAERFMQTEGALTFPVTVVTWALVSSENSKSILTSHLAVTVYVGKNPKNSGVAAWISSKPFRVSKSAPETSEQCAALRDRRVSEAYSQALYSYLGSSKLERSGRVIWYDKSGGVGMLEDAETKLSIRFYACNFVGADSHFPELVKNVTVDRGDGLRFAINPDPYISLHIGATELKVA